LKNVVVRWCDEFILEILRKNPIKSIRIKTHLDISIIYPSGVIFLIDIKKFISKGLLKIRFNSNLSKVHNYHLFNVSQIKDFTLNLIISIFSPIIVLINNLA
jgi:hypothetical protein